jgi:hypothetical protein
VNPKKEEEERTKTERDQEEHENVNTKKTETCGLPQEKRNFSFPSLQVVDLTNQTQTQRNQDDRETRIKKK